MVKDFEVGSHVFVPKHELLSEKEQKKLLEEYAIQPANLPKIFINDQAIRGLSVKEGDIIKITRTSPTMGISYFYRIVVNE